jgi:hypothetical protein
LGIAGGQGQEAAGKNRQQRQGSQSNKNTACFHLPIISGMNENL